MIRGPVTRASSGPPLLVIGASVRAAAFSALRAGFTPICFDQFSDVDLQAVAESHRVGRDAAEFLSVVTRHPGVPIVFAGGLENHPEVVAKLAETHPVWGVDAEQISQVRDPEQVTAALKSARLPCLEVCSSQEPPDPDGDWLLKPLRSAGGRGIVPWTSEVADAPTLAEPHYFQKRAEGTSYSGVFVGYEGVGDVRFVGLTEQLIGETSFHGQPFAWCGNIGPVVLSVEVESRVRRIANYLKWKFALRGLFGVDFVVTPDGELGVTEVNPRYPASVEILEYTTGTSLMREHAVCFQEDLELTENDWEPAVGSVLGKGIVYSPARATVQFQLTFDQNGYRRWPRYADVPPAGTSLERGEPVLTVFAHGGTGAECRERLMSNAASLVGGS